MKNFLITYIQTIEKTEIIQAHNLTNIKTDSINGEIVKIEEIKREFSWSNF